MLILRTEQIDAFWNVLEPPITRSVVEFVRANHATAVVQLGDRRTVLAKLADETLARMVRLGVARAHGHAAWDEPSIREFVVLMLTAAPNFDQHPAVAQMLAKAGIPLGVRLSHVRKEMSGEDWAEVRSSYDASFWQPAVEASRPRGDRSLGGETDAASRS